jgi:DNA-binding transcriptional ArsR family regulator
MCRRRPTCRRSAPRSARYVPNQSAQLDRVFQALSDPTRRAVLQRLSGGTAAVSELARPFDMALPSFLQHLDVFEDSGLVRSRKSGRVRTYQLSPRPLVLERIVDVSPELVWMAWTQPEHLKKWFTPAPWTTVDCEIDLRPGGIFRTVMRSPEGQDFPNLGCYLEVVPHQKLVWTDVLEAHFRPARQEPGSN